MSTSVTIHTLIDDHHASVYRYAYRLCGSREDAEDLTQQTFLLAQKNLAQLRELGKAASWLLTITRRNFIRWLEKRPSRVASDVAWNEIPGRPGQSTLEHGDLHDSLGQLPEEFRLVLLMFYFENLSYKEIAEQLGIAIGTVMSRLSRAKQRLREQLGDEPTISADSANTRPSSPLHSVNRANPISNQSSPTSIPQP